MKKITLFLIVMPFLLSFKSYSSNLKDSTTIIHEFSVSYDLSTSNHINFNYARKISTKNWLKFGLNFSGSFISNEPITQTSYPTSYLSIFPTLLIGIEHHKIIKSNIEFISGFNLRVISGFVYSKVENPNWPVRMQNTITTDFNYGIGGTFGIYYKVSDFFSIGSSINPIVTYERDSYSSFNTTSVRLILTDMSLLCVRYYF
ncbi:MAG: hypothetical protein RBS13_04750 [Bacteroidales bacterium]|jgi:hypothetical protein|nr:hypothetical protein [Bacteroidales bacterium]